MRTPFHPRTVGNPSFALISVLALVSLAALTATAFLASARLEKTASMSTGDQTRLTLALDCGYHLGSYPLFRGDDVWNWADFLIGEDSDGVGYLFHGVPYSGTNAGTVGQWANYALFSSATLSNIGVTTVNPASFYATNTWQGGFASNRLNPTSQLCNLTNFSTTNVTPTGPVTRIPLLFGRTSPVVNWITNYTTNPSTGLLTPTFRFAYFTEDPSGLIDAERMGGSTTRNTGTNPNEIALQEIGLTNFSTFTTLRKVFLNPGLIQEAIRNNNVTNGSVTNPWRYLSSSFYSANGWLSTGTNNRQANQRIPAGLGYAEADTAKNGDTPVKYNLNDFFSNGVATSGALNTIVGAISSNLPSFASDRAGGFLLSAGGGATNTNAYTTNAYLQTLAASIIDYADTDSTPTTDGAGTSTNNARPTFRGVDSHPFVNEYVTCFNLLSTNAATVGGVNGQAIIIVTTDYVELWNLCNRTNTGTLTFSAINRQPFTAGFSPFNFTNPLWASNAQGPVTQGVSSNSTNVTLNPNQFLVIGFPAVTNCFFYQDTNLTLPLTLPDDINSSYKVAWNNVVYDGALGGLRRQNKNLSAINSPKWSGTCPSFVGEDLTAFWNMSGDPRATIYQSKPQSSISYDTRSSFGGRNFRNGLTTNPYGEVKPSLWPDGGHDSAKGNLPTAGVNTPPTATPTAAYSNCPPCRISNAGFYSNVCELGNIFDPIQWFDSGGIGATNGYGSDGGQWINLTPTAVASNVYGGGTTLRIGRAELGKFAWTNVSGQPQPNMAASAAALLDIFCATTNQPNYLSGRFDDGDQVNINTAPPRVLRALAAGVVLSNDPSTNFVLTNNAVDNFVKGVTNFRARYPFYSPSQLTFIGTATNWPNTNTWPSNAVFTTNGMGLTEADDAAVEEWFNKIYSLSKVYTRNYRIYVQAQLIKTRGTNTNVSNLSFGAIGRRYYDVFNQQNNSGAGVTPSCSLYLLRKVDY